MIKFKSIILFITCLFSLSIANGMEQQDASEEAIKMTKRLLALKFEYRGEELRTRVEELSRNFNFPEIVLRKCLEQNSCTPSDEGYLVSVYLSKNNSSVKESILGAACMPLESERYANIPKDLIKQEYEIYSPDIIEQKLFCYEKYHYDRALFDWGSSSFLASELCIVHPFARWFAEHKIKFQYIGYTLNVNSFFNLEKFADLLTKPYLPIAYGEKTGTNRRQYYVDLVKYLDAEFYEATKSFKDTENCRSNWHDCYKCYDCLKAGYDRELDFYEIKKEAGSGYLINYLEEYKECWSESTKAKLENILTKREYESIFGKDSVEEEESSSGNSGSFRQALTAKSRKQAHNKMVQDKRSLVMKEKKSKSKQESDQSESD